MNLYESQYRSLQFERAGLFKVIQEKYHSRDVLYPGCSVHITPSFYFPHVVYVDQSEAAGHFFANEKPLLEFVNRNKQYKQSAYIHFIQQDFSVPLPLRAASFDLLLALFAGGVARSCAQYLKVGGFLLTNNHQGDALDAINHPDLKLTATVRFHKKVYMVSEDDLNEQAIALPPPDHKYLKQAERGMKYIENETYYLFQRLR